MYDSGAESPELNAATHSVARFVLCNHPQRYVQLLLAFEDDLHHLGYKPSVACQATVKFRYGIKCLNLNEVSARKHCCWQQQRQYCSFDNDSITIILAGANKLEKGVQNEHSETNGAASRCMALRASSACASAY